MKSLTGQATYATNKHIKPIRNPPYKSPTYFAFTALLCCACMFASLPGTTMLNSRSNTPPAENNIQTSAPTGKAEQNLDRKTQQQEQTRSQGPGIKPAEPALLQPDNRSTNTARTPTEEREISPPCCKYAYSNKLEKRAQAQTHAHRVAAKRKETGANQEPRHGAPRWPKSHTTPTPPIETYKRPNVPNRETEQMHIPEGGPSGDISPPPPP